MVPHCMRDVLIYRSATTKTGHLISLRAGGQCSRRNLARLNHQKGARDADGFDGVIHIGLITRGIARTDLFGR